MLKVRRLPRNNRALEKRLLSPEFLERVEKAIAQATTSGNTTPVYQILAAFERTRYFRGLVVYFGERTGFLPEFQYGHVRLKRKVRPSATPATLKACLAQHEGSISEALCPQARMTPASHVDALVTGIRLPGSYGTSRRR